MPEEKNIVHNETTTEEKMKELFDLMDEKAAAGELNEIEEEPAKAGEDAHAQEENGDEEPMSASERAGYEYAMMMRQYEAMLEEYMRLEAEEKAAKKKAEEEAKAKETE